MHGFCELPNIFAFPNFFSQNFVKNARFSSHFQESICL